MNDSVNRQFSRRLLPRLRNRRSRQPSLSRAPEAGPWWRRPPLPPPPIRLR